MIDTKQFILAGNATFTMTSRKSGTRFTYKVRKSKDGNCFFVSLLNGNDNENSYRFFGTLFPSEQEMVFRHGRPERTPITPDAPSAQGFAWFARNLNQPSNLAANVEVHHEGKCCCCGRKLTVPKSVELGVGPECAERLGIAF
jgi:hypothetical protein